MTQEEKIQAIAALFEVSPAQLTPETMLDSLNWDSMTKLTTLAMFQADFGKKLAVETMLSFRTIRDMLAAAE